MNCQFKQKDLIKNPLYDASRRWKMMVINHYTDGSNKCRCGEEDDRCLTISHKNGSGEQHRKSLGIHGGWKFYKWVVRNEYPSSIDVLCMNCQMVDKFEKGQGFVPSTEFIISD